MKKMLVLIIVMLFGSVCLAYGQTAKEAYKALRKLDAKIEMGIS